MLKKTLLLKFLIFKKKIIKFLKKTNLSKNYIISKKKIYISKFKLCCKLIISRE